MKSLILADQTGVGKGRVVASAIRWAVLNGYKAIFMTYKDTLWYDMLRDLEDIGFLDNTKCTIYNTKQEQIEYNDKVICKRNKNYSNQNIIFTTYTQIQSRTTKRNEQSDQKILIDSIAHESVLILDEAHEGASSVGFQDSFKARGAKKESNRFLFLFSLFRKIKGILYSSATYAKRPDNLMLYYPFTAMVDSFGYEQLLNILKETQLIGQSILSNALVEAGQLIRRESSFEGITYNDLYTSDIFPDDDIRVRENWDKYATIMQEIQKFDSKIKPILLQNKKREHTQNDEFSKIGNVDSLKIESSNFASRLHNLIALLDLSLKAQATVEYVKNLILKKNEKVIIVLNNTMGSLINSEYPVGTQVDTTLKAIFRKALYSLLSYTVRKWKTTEYYTISLSELKFYPEAYNKFKEIESMIESIDTNDPLSPIDYITHKLNKVGIEVLEITGRTTYVDYDSRFQNKPRKREKTESISNKFNNSKDFNCIILNSSGSTGISLHASEKFKDKRKRHMVLIQPSLDINVVMQSLGRIHRTGQVVLPEYTFINLPIPVAYRLQIVLRKKLSSLNANTKGSSGKSESTLKNVQDMANFIGDECVYEYLLSNADINELLDNPLKLGTEQADTYKAFLKVSGRIAVLRVDQQEEFYDYIFDKYTGKLADYEAQGISLDNEPIDLQAETISSQVIIQGNPEGKILEKPAYLETVKVKTEKINIENEVNKLVLGKENDILNQADTLFYEYKKNKEAQKESKRNERK